MLGRTTTRPRHSAESALGIFDQLGSHIDKADAYRVIGAHAIARRAAIPWRNRGSGAPWSLATSTGSILSEAEVAREMALLLSGHGPGPGCAGLSKHGPHPCLAGWTPDEIWWMWATSIN